MANFSARPPPRGQLGFFLADFLVGTHAIVLLFADQRAHLGFAIERRAQFDVLGLFGHGIDKLFVDRLLHQDAAAGGTNFALVDEHAEQRAIDGGFEIGIGEKNVGRFAAEFERDALHRVGSLLDDDFADRGAAGKGDLVDVGMLHQRRSAGFAEAGNDVDHAGRQAASASQFAISSAVRGVCSAGFKTHVQPAARAGASFHAAISSG